MLSQSELRRRISSEDESIKKDFDSEPSYGRKRSALSKASPQLSQVYFVPSSVETCPLHSGHVEPSIMGDGSTTPTKWFSAGDSGLAYSASAVRLRHDSVARELLATGIVGPGVLCERSEHRAWESFALPADSNRRKTCSLTSFVARDFQGSNRPEDRFTAHVLFAVESMGPGGFEPPASAL